MTETNEMASPGWFSKEWAMSFLTPQNIVVAAVSLIAAATFVYILVKAKQRYIDWPEIPLVKLESPMVNSQETLSAPDSGTLTITGRGKTSESPITIFRPYNHKTPADYYGVFRVDKSSSATLVVSNTEGYHEVVVYKYPSWEVSYAETNINEVPMDFLENGDYVIAVFSPSLEIRGTLQTAPNTSRPRPKSRVHRVTSAQIAENRDITVAASVNALAPTGTREILRVFASETSIWPKPVFTRIQTLYTPIPPTATAIFISVPSYGYVMEGADEHLGQVIHEGNNAAVYRAVARPAALAGGKLVDATTDPTTIDSVGRVISVTVMYPDISPDSPATTSPGTAVFVFAPSMQ
jgi:hypothetical protein